MPAKKTFFKSKPDKDKSMRSDAPSPLPLDRNEDFAQDPEARFSRPPWPFRMVCKIVETLIDIVWGQIEQREAERERQTMKIRLPLYQCEYVIESERGGIKAMEVTADMRWLIVVEEGCMSVRDCGTGSVVDQLSFEGVKVEDLHEQDCLWWLSVAAYGVDCHIIAVGNEKGLSLCMFCMGKLVLIRDKGFLDGVDGIGRIQFSSSGECLAITRTGDTDPNKQYIEFFTLPIATWKTEVENAVQHLEAATTEYQGDEEEGTPSQVAEMEEKLRTLHTMLAKPSLMMRVHPQPPPPISRFTDPFQGCSDTSGSILSAGLNHPLTQCYFESSGKPLERPIMRVGGFHFVKSVGIPRPTTEDMVVVWWTSCHIVYFYALVNQGKELDAKPVNILPLFTTAITCTAVSSDSQILATGQPDGITVIWDLFSRLAIATVSCFSVSITALSVSLLGNHEYDVIVGSAEGELARIKTNAFGAGYEANKFDCDPDDVNLINRLQVLSSMPALVLVSKTIDNNFLSLYDIASGQGLCQISLPVDTAVKHYSLPNSGQKLYALGRDSKVYSISLSQCGMVKRFLQEPAMQFDFNPSELTADHIAKKLLDEDIEKYQGMPSEEFSARLKELFDSVRPKVKDLVERRQGRKHCLSRNRTSKTGSTHPFDFSVDEMVMT